MYSELTPAVERALAQIGGDASSARLILHLLIEEEGRAAEWFRSVDANLNWWIEQLNGCVHLPEPTVTRILAAASTIAQETAGERTIGSNHVAMAFVRESIAFQSILDQHGMDWNSLIPDASGLDSNRLAVDEPVELCWSLDQFEAARILDVNANRAREALRVLDDFARFIRNDPWITRELKQLRHDLAAATQLLGDRLLTSARDTTRDVGTAVSTDSEVFRASPHQVAIVNLKRLQESLRSLEEYGKLFSPAFAAQCEQIRYRAYTLDKVAAARPTLEDARLYLLASATHSATSLEYLIQESITGGVDVVQLREKNLTDRELIRRAEHVRRWTRDAGVVFIVNDRPDVARLVDADGVHLGQDDLPAYETRRIVGGEAIIGVSTHDLDQLDRAIRDGAAYVGIGPVFPSATKSFGALAGLDYVSAATQFASLPMFALGGITQENLSQVLSAGASRIAVSSIICRSDDPQSVARELKRRITGA